MTTDKAHHVITFSTHTVIAAQMGIDCILARQKEDDVERAGKGNV